MPALSRFQLYFQKSIKNSNLRIWRHFATRSNVWLTSRVVETEAKMSTAIQRERDVEKLAYRVSEAVKASGLGRGETDIIFRVTISFLQIILCFQRARNGPMRLDTLSAGGNYRVSG
jgi:hypothetical protein